MAHFGTGRLGSVMLSLLIPCGMLAQQPAPAPATAPTPEPAGTAASRPQPGTPPDKSGDQQPDKRIFGVLPNYRTAPKSAEYHSITPRQKFTIAMKDSFDYPVYFGF